MQLLVKIAVTPLAGVWIEIQKPLSRWLWQWPVTPLAGVWIEIVLDLIPAVASSVTPLAGVWIEIEI